LLARFLPFFFFFLKKKKKIEEEKQDVGDAKSIGDLPDFLSYGGITEEEACRRITVFGPNSIPMERMSLPKRLFVTFTKPMALFLFGVVILCGAIQDWVAFVVVLGLTILNGLVAVFEEIKRYPCFFDVHFGPLFHFSLLSEKAIDTLRASMGIDSNVRRAGVWSVIPAELLVPGDLVKMKLGDMIPADCVLQSGRDLEIDQSAITGESLPVTRGSRDMVYSGSLIVSGNMTAVVVGTGIHSVYGRSAQLMREPKTQTKLQQFIFSIAITITIVALILSTILVIVKLTTTAEPAIKVIQSALVLLVAAVPIAMAVVITTSLALGSRELASVGVITARLNAIEQLAGMDVALCDKTGTLTQNKLELAKPWLCDGYTEEELLMYASLASSAEAPDAIDKVIAERMGLASAQLAKKFEVRDYVPFDPVKKRASAVVWNKVEKCEMEVVKGAPQIVVEYCKLNADMGGRVMAVVQGLASRGVRGLGVAIRPARGEWSMVGVMALIDALRPEAGQVIKELAEEGVEVKMVTGDGFDIARETCRLLGMYTNTIGRQELLRITASQNDDWASKKIDLTDAFSEVFPEDKFDVVAVLQRNGHVVGMTGDGVNDAPALRKADIGIAVHGAADAARVAADIVFTRLDMTVLSDAVIVSRMIFERLRNYILFRVNCTAVILFWTFIGTVRYNFQLPPLSYVLMAGFNNFTILALAFDHIVPEKRPLRWEYRDIVPTVLMQSVIATMEVFVTYSLCANGLLWYSFRPSIEAVRTVVFFGIVVSTQTAVFIVRVRGFFFLPKSPRPGLSITVCVFGVSLFSMLLCRYWPFGGGLGPVHWVDIGMTLLIGVVFLFIKDVIKVLTYFVMSEVWPPVAVIEPKLKSVSAANREDYEEVPVQPVEDIEMMNHIILK
jgi:H+-transporting ATPase